MNQLVDALLYSGAKKNRIRTLADVDVPVVTVRSGYFAHARSCQAPRAGLARNVKEMVKVSGIRCCEIN